MMKEFAPSPNCLFSVIECMSRTGADCHFPRHHDVTRWTNPARKKVSLFSPSQSRADRGRQTEIQRTSKNTPLNITPPTPKRQSPHCHFRFVQKQFRDSGAHRFPSFVPLNVVKDSYEAYQQQWDKSSFVPLPRSIIFDR